jgi:Leucine-rich repeat (LRR) protein
MSPLLLLLLLAIALPLPPATAQLAPAPASPVKEDKVRCLRGVKQGLKDPDGNLASWTFTNITPGTICEFAGVFCWNRGESLSIALELSGFGLQGAVPSSLQYCRSTTMLDLSNNSLSGPIPAALCDWLPFLVKLDLSGNRLSGPIPSELANCRFLSSLKLSGNKLSGQIP